MKNNKEKNRPSYDVHVSSDLPEKKVASPSDAER